MTLDQIVHIGGLLILAAGAIISSIALWQDWREMIRELKK